jgi:hypothetical protein
MRFNHGILSAAVVTLAAIFCATAPAATTEFKNPGVASYTMTYKSGTTNTVTIKGKNFDLYSLLGLSPLNTSPAGSAQFSVAGSAQISVFTSNGNAPVYLLSNLLTSNANFYYTVSVSKKGLAKANCKSFTTNNSFFSFTATDDSPPTKGIFTLSFVVENVGFLPVKSAKSPTPTLQGLPNVTLQIGSAYFTTPNIKKNRATYP